MSRSAPSPEHQRRTKVFFVDQGDASFILSDLELLRGSCMVRRWSFLARGAWTPWALLQCLGVSIANVPHADVVVTHFAGWGSWLPLCVAKLVGRPSLLFVHGADCVSFPAIGYGNFRKWPLSLITRWCYKLASTIVPVHATLVRSSSTFVSDQPVAQGILVHVAGSRTPMRVVPHGFRSQDWPLGIGMRDVDVLTVGMGFGDPAKRILKGIDLLIEAARITPQFTYVVVGWDGPPDIDVPNNMTIQGRVERGDLVALYQRARFYAQLSISEGFGCALAEAMLCGAVPIVSDAGSLPDVAGGTGYVLKKKNAEAFTALLNDASRSLSSQQAVVSRGSISSRFPEEQRRDTLLGLVHNAGSPA